MAPRVFLHPFLRVDHQQGGLRLRRPSNHVLDELLVSRRVNNHVAALRRPEPDLRGINTDVLVAFGLQRVHQVCPFKGHPAPLCGLLELLQLAFGQRARVVQQPAHQGGLAVVHMAQDDDLELLGGNGRNLRWRGGVHRRITCTRPAAVSQRPLRFPGLAPAPPAPASACGVIPRRSPAPCGLGT